MKKLRYSAFLAALMLSTLSACSSTDSGRRTVGQYVDDATITASVKAGIVNEPTLKVSDIQVETYEGVVQLSGFVSSAANIATASTVARSVNGVKSVKNDIRLK
jgi:osmotically-inducible protein OsmY